MNVREARSSYHGILDSRSLEVGQEPLKDLFLGALAVQVERVLLDVVDTLVEKQQIRNRFL